MVAWPLVHLAIFGYVIFGAHIHVVIVVVLSAHTKRSVSLAGYSNRFLLSLVALIISASWFLVAKI